MKSRVRSDHRQGMEVNYLTDTGRHVIGQVTGVVSRLITERHGKRRHRSGDGRGIEVSYLSWSGRGRLARQYRHWRASWWSGRRPCCPTPTSPPPCRRRCGPGVSRYQHHRHSRSSAGRCRSALKLACDWPSSWMIAHSRMVRHVVDPCEKTEKVMKLGFTAQMQLRSYNAGIH